MASPYLPIPFKTPFNVDFSKGNTLITFLGDIPEKSNSFKIVLQAENEGNVGLYFEPNMEAGFIVRKSSKGGSWIEEEKSGPCPLKAGDPFEIMILIEKDEFEIAVNGQPFTKYKHNIEPKDLKFVKVEGDIHLAGVNFFNETIDEDDSNNFRPSSKPIHTEGRGSTEGPITSSKAQPVKGENLYGGYSYNQPNQQYSPPINTNPNFYPNNSPSVNLYQNSNSLRGNSPNIGFNIPQDLLNQGSSDQYNLNNQSQATSASNFYNDNNFNSIKTGLSTNSPRSDNAYNSGATNNSYKNVDYYGDYYGEGDKKTEGEAWKDPLASGGGGGSGKPAYKVEEPGSDEEGETNYNRPQGGGGYGENMGGQGGGLGNLAGLFGSGGQGGGGGLGALAGLLSGGGQGGGGQNIPQTFPGRKSKFDFANGSGLAGAAATAIGAYAMNRLLNNRNNMGGGGMGGGGGGMGGLSGLFGSGGGGGGAGNPLANMILGAVGSAAGSKMGYDITNQIPGMNKLSQSGVPTGMIGSFIGSLMGNKLVRQ
ncbi:unnamed protein product [Gordionus sp. m RMFG-2023]